MRRCIGFFALTALIGVVAARTVAFGQDKVERGTRRAARSFVTGKILEENAGGVKVKAQGLGKEETIPSNEIIRDDLRRLPDQGVLDIGKLAAAEAAHDLPALLKGYEARPGDARS